MQDELTRAQHYRDLALQIRSIARLEPDRQRRIELIDRAVRHDALAERLVAQHANGRG